jgi:hypothetical protein
MRADAFKDVNDLMTAYSVLVTTCKENILDDYCSYSKIIKDTYQEAHEYLYSLHEAGLEFTPRQATMLKIDFDIIDKAYKYICDLEYIASKEEK